MAEMKRYFPAFLFVGSLVLYVCTLAPTVTFVDSGELIVAAKNLGVAHPPGFPLYLLVAHLATLIPLGNVAQRVNFVSALCAAFTVALVYLLAMEAVRSQQLLLLKRGASKSRKSATEGPHQELIIFLPGLVAAAIAAFSRTLWNYATVAEVYTLNALLILLVCLLVLRWRNQALGEEMVETLHRRQAKKKAIREEELEPSDVSLPESRYEDNHLLYLASFVFGLALCVHHVTAALTFPAIMWLIFTAKGRKRFGKRQLVIVTVACLAGLCFYAYLPWAASRSPVLNWGDPGTLGRFWKHLTGSQYQSNFALSAEQAWRQAASFLGLLFREFGWPWFPAGLLAAGVGVYSIYRKDRVLLAFGALIVFFNLMFAVAYDIAEDKNAYLIPIFLAVAIAAGFGVQTILNGCKARRRAIVAAVLLLIPTLSFAANVRVNNRHEYRVAEDYVHNILESVSPGGLLITADWQVASPMLYFQEIERERPDVICIDVLLLRRSWYCAYLESKYPALMSWTRAEVLLFKEDLERWEQNPEIYQRDPQLTQRIDKRYCSMISMFVKNHLAAGSVYATSDVVLSSGGENQTLSKTLLGNYQIVPQGLVFQLYADRDLHPAELPQFRMRGLIDRPPVINEDPVIRQKVLPAYATMLVNCGRAFAAQQDGGREMECYRLAWSIDPSYVVQQNLLPPGISF